MLVAAFSATQMIENIYSKTQVKFLDSFSPKDWR